MTQLMQKKTVKNLKTLLFEYGFRLPIFEIVERRDQYQGYGLKNVSARSAAQSNYKQADRTANEFLPTFAPAI